MDETLKNGAARWSLLTPTFCITDLTGEKGRTHRIEAGARSAKDPAHALLNIVTGRRDDNTAKSGIMDVDSGVQSYLIDSVVKRLYMNTPRVNTYLAPFDTSEKMTFPSRLHESCDRTDIVEMIASMTTPAYRNLRSYSSKPCVASLTGFI